MQNVTSARKLFAASCWESFKEQQTTSATKLLQASMCKNTRALSFSLCLAHTLAHACLNALANF